MRQSSLRDRLYETFSRSKTSNSQTSKLTFRGSSKSPKKSSFSSTKRFASTSAIASMRMFDDEKEDKEEEDVPTFSNVLSFSSSERKVPETSSSPSKVEQKSSELGFLDSLSLTRPQMKKVIKGSFLYLLKCKDGVTPYDFEVVSHEKAVGPQKLNSYYTLSKQGLTCFKSDGDTSFTSLTDIELEYGIYHKIQKIPFFQKYRSWKCFYAWRKRISRRKRRTATCSLKKKMFLFDQKLQKPLLNVFIMCADIRATELIEVEKSKTYVVCVCLSLSPQRQQQTTYSHFSYFRIHLL